MAKLKFDFRTTLREIANRIQDANQARLLGGQAIAGGPLAPDRVAAAPTKTRKRIRLDGIRVKLSELAGRVGVKTGDMLRDCVRRANVKLGRIAFRILPSQGLRLRWFVFNKGAQGRQVARAFSGIPGEVLDDAAAAIARQGRDQLVAAMNDREDADAER